MKKKVVSLVSLVSAVLTLFSLVALAGCKKSPSRQMKTPSSSKRRRNTAARRCFPSWKSCKRRANELYRLGRMIVELNGTEQTASSYWMLYTSDKENANEQWGTFEYEGEVLGSAVSGAGELTVKEGCLYIWAFESFGI